MLGIVISIISNKGNLQRILKNFKIMKKAFGLKFLILLLLIVYSCGFTLIRQDLVHPLLHKQKQILGQCSSDRVNTVYLAINSCESSSQQNTADCIKINLQSKFNQYWGAYVQASSALAGVNYWYWDDCSITLSNYGRYYRTYRIWKASSSPSPSLFQMKNLQQKFEVQNSQIQQKNKVQIIGSCSSSRISAVNSVLSQCNTADVQNSVDCIKNQLNLNLKQYWNAFGRGDYSMAGVSSWSADDCSLSYRSYGLYMRTYVIWKAA